MNKKLVYILISTLLILTALPVTSTINENRSVLVEPLEYEIDNEIINIIFVSGIGFRVIIQNLENDTKDIYVKINLTKVFGYIDLNETITFGCILKPYDEVTIPTFPIFGICIGSITAEVYYQNSHEFICGKSVNCLIILIYHWILHSTEAWY